MLHSGSLESCWLREGRTVDDRQHQAAQREERRAQRAEQVELLRTRAVCHMQRVSYRVRMGIGTG